jgi:hypothetical protein
VDDKLNCGASKQDEVDKLGDGERQIANRTPNIKTLLHPFADVVKGSIGVAAAQAEKIEKAKSEWVAQGLDPLVIDALEVLDVEGFNGPMPFTAAALSALDEPRFWDIEQPKCLILEVSSRLNALDTELN